MLMQTFKSAKELDIKEKQKDALIKTLVLFETGKVVYVPKPSEYNRLSIEPSFSGKFNMSWWDTPFENCGTVCCIGGTAGIISGINMNPRSTDDPLYYLFYPNVPDHLWQYITVEQAAQALRSFLSTGEFDWEQILGLK